MRDVILSDIDGCVTRTVERVLEHLRFKHRISEHLLNIEHIKHHDIAVDLQYALQRAGIVTTIDALKTRLDKTYWNEPSFYKDLQPHETLCEMLRGARIRGCDVHFVSARPANTFSVTADWLRKQNLLPHGDSQDAAQRLIVNIPSALRPELCKQLSATMYVDDNQETMTLIRRAHPQLKTLMPPRPWNTEFRP